MSQTSIINLCRLKAREDKPELSFSDRDKAITTDEEWQQVSAPNLRFGALILDRIEIAYES